MGNLINDVVDKIRGRVGDVNEPLKRDSLIKVDRYEQPEKLADQATDLLSDNGHPVGSEGTMNILGLNVYTNIHHIRPMVYFCSSQIHDIQVARSGGWLPRLPDLRRNVFIDPKLVEMLCKEATAQPEGEQLPDITNAHAIMHALNVRFKIYRDGIGLYLVDGLTKAQSIFSKAVESFVVGGYVLAGAGQGGNVDFTHQANQVVSLEMQLDLAQIQRHLAMRAEDCRVRFREEYCATFREEYIPTFHYSRDPYRRS